MERIWLKSYPEGVPADIDVNQLPTLGRLIDDSCTRFADSVAYVQMGRSLKFSDIDRLARHFAAYLQKTYGSHVLLSAADWRFVEQEKKAPGVEGGEVPKHDLEVTDGQVLTLGDTSVSLYLTPGHTPGTVSAIVPVTEAGRSYKLALFGSVLFPANREPTDSNGGLALYQQSITHFDRVSSEAKVDGILNTHTFIDGTAERLERVRVRVPNSPNPFLIGTANAHRYHAILRECVSAALSRLDEAKLEAPKQQASN